MNTHRRFQTHAIAIVCGAWLLGSLALGQPAGQLTLREENETFVVQFSGRAGNPGIPSWKIVLQRDDAGNISDLRVPADSPNKLSSNRPVTTILTGNKEGVEGTLSEGREAFGTTRAEVFQAAEKSLEKIIIRAGGPSKNKHCEQHFTYTFTPAGVRVESTVVALINLTSVGLWPPWDYREIADSHIKAVPIRTQGSPKWASLKSTGHDRPVPLPEGVNYPLEIELMLKRPTPTYVKIYYDKNFEGAKEKRLIGHNTKAVPAGPPQAFIKNFAMTKGSGLLKGERETFAYRYEFETR